MIDRNARDQLAEALRSYMDDKITAFELDSAMGKVQTQDKSARKIRLWLWLHYDDLKDHKVVASKAQWDYFNRLLLLLASDAEIEVVRSCFRWHISQAFAAFGVASCILVIFRAGVGEQLFFWAFPFGAASMIIRRVNSQRRNTNRRSGLDRLAPFPSFSSVRAIRRSVPAFAKTPYRAAIRQRQVRSPIVSKVLWTPWIAIWFAVGPLALLVQSLPESEVATEIGVRKPQSAGT